MKTLRFILIGVFSFVLLGILLAGLGWHQPRVQAAPAATTRYVLGENGVDSGACTDSQNPCRTIQYALDQSSSGDTIRVANQFVVNVYTGTLSIDQSLTLQGGWVVVNVGGFLDWRRHTPCQAFRTVLDGEGNGRVISITGNIAPVIDCLTITGGDAAGMGGEPDNNNDVGGGIYSQDAAPLITNNIITGNYGCSSCAMAYGRGGGIYLLNAPATAVISDNVIANNIADDGTWGQGGGIYLRNSNAQVLSNTIASNRAGHSVGYGGGIAVRNGSPTIADNVIYQNIAGQGVQGLGGGIYISTTYPVTIARNYIELNKALNGTGTPPLINYGGGIYFNGPLAVIRDNEVYGNVATVSDQRGWGGGMYLHNLSASAVVAGNVIANDNRASYTSDGNGGGIYLHACDATVTDNHIFQNIAASGSPGYGGGIYISRGGGVIHSNVITGNNATADAVTGSGWGGGMAIVDSTVLVQNNHIANNTADSAPSATGYGGGIYIQTSSPQIIGNHILNNWTSGGGAGFGGGVYITHSLGVVIDSNTLSDNVADDDGGGLYVELSDDATISDNHIYSNTADTRYGGGICMEDSDDVSIARNTLLHNQARYGGAMYLHTDGVLDYAFNLENNIVADNQASNGTPGIYIKGGTAYMSHNTLASNSGGSGEGVYLSSADAVLTNTILVDHATGLYVTSGDSASLEGTLWGSGSWANTADTAGSGTINTGTVNIYQVPGFVAPAMDNYHLAGTSPAIDAGVTSSTSDDIDGDTRPAGSAPDIGADELTCLAQVGSTTYTRIQEAISAATTWQTVRVAAGVCYENLVITETLTLEGGWNTSFTSRSSDPAATTIDGSGAGRVISITEQSGTIAPTVDGLTLTGGNATGLAGSGVYGYDIGGGLYGYQADVTVNNCVITDSIAGQSGVAWGGGIGIFGGSLTLSNSTVAGNTASAGGNGYGGGVYLRHTPVSSLTDNQIYNNLGSADGYGFGGGLCVMFGDADLQDNAIFNNTASLNMNNYGGGIRLYSADLNMDGDHVYSNHAEVTGMTSNGGGIDVTHNSTLVATGIQVYDNQAISGGGIYASDSSEMTLAASQVYSNTAGLGGGYYCSASQTDISTSQFYNNDAGYAGGIQLTSCDDAYIGQSSIHDNTSAGLAGGLWVYSSNNVWVENTMIVDNQLTGSDGAGVMVFNNADATLAHTTIARNQGGNGQGVYLTDNAAAWLTNTIIASHTVGLEVNTGCSAWLEGTLWGDGRWANGTNKINNGTIDDGEIIVIGDPGFINPGQGDYHIGPRSDAIDQAIDLGLSEDIDGDLRPIGDSPDIGADEAPHWVFLPLVMRQYE